VSEAAVNFEPFDYREPSYSPKLWAVARTVAADSTSLSSSSAESGVASTRWIPVRPTTDGMDRHTSLSP
jgi:hypothetical protein